MSVDVEAGNFYVGGARYAYAGGNQAVDAAHATLNRYDIIYFQSDGLHYAAGTPAAAPAMPVLPAASLLAAVIYVAAAATSIVDADIRDERVVLGSSPDLGPPRYLGGTGADGALHVTGATNVDASAGKHYTSITVDSGQTLTFTGARNYVFVSGDVTNAGTIKVGTTAGGTAQDGGNGGQPTAGAAYATPYTFWKPFRGLLYPFTPGTSSAGTRGSANLGGTPGSAGTAGNLASSLYLEVAGNLTVGTFQANGTAGGNGGNGVSDGSSGDGGGGGGGGGSAGTFMFVVGGNVSSGTIEAIGADGGNGGNGDAVAPETYKGYGGGGGAGGDGGYVVMFYRGTYGSPTITLTEGAGGTKGADVGSGAGVGNGGVGGGSGGNRVAGAAGGAGGTTPANGANGNAGASWVYAY
ncbi:MAG: hypothetical protein M0R66_01360 [Candidatus Omnitrophica bacterium]|nr:hypothetical protein [Candidatus Omnitrophota bacterium]